MKTGFKTFFLVSLALFCVSGCRKDENARQEDRYPSLVCAGKSYPFESTESGYVLKSFASSPDGFGIKLEKDGAILCSLIPEAPLGKWCLLHSDVNPNCQPAGTYDIYLNNDLTAACVVSSGVEAPEYCLDNSAFYMLWDDLDYMDPANLFAFNEGATEQYMGAWPGLFSDKHININGKEYLYWVIDSQYGFLGESLYFIVCEWKGEYWAQSSETPVIGFSSDYIYHQNTSTREHSIFPFD